MPPLTLVTPVYVLWPVSVKVSLPTLVTPPVPLMTPLKVGLSPLLLPVVSVPLPSMTLPLPASDQTVSLRLLSSKIAGELTTSGLLLLMVSTLPVARAPAVIWNVPPTRVMVPVPAFRRGRVTVEGRDGKVGSVGDGLQELRAVVAARIRGQGVDVEGKRHRRRGPDAAAGDDRQVAGRGGRRWCRCRFA